MWRALPSGHLDRMTTANGRRALAASRPLNHPTCHVAMRTTQFTRRLALARCLAPACAAGVLAWAGAPLAWAATPSKTIERHTFAGEVTVGTQTLVLNGVGVRQVAWFKGYVCGLYLPRPTSSPAQALAMPGAKRVSMRVLVDVSSDEFAKAFTKGVNRNAVPGELAAMQPRIQAFDSVIRSIGKLKKGDAVEVDWRPGLGTVAVVNGKDVGRAVAGEDLFVAMLKIYLGDRPTDEPMKSGLLGLR